MSDTRTVSQIIASPRYVPNKAYRLEKLASEFRAAGIVVSYYDSDGFVFEASNPASALQAVVDAHDPSLNAMEQYIADRPTARAAAVNAVKDLVGISFLTMTAVQRQTLVGALAYKLGALDKDLKVRPLNDWLD